MCHGFLDFDSKELNEEFEKMKGSHVRFFKLQEIIHDNLARHCKLIKEDDESDSVVTTNEKVNG
jgi:hypothetical protein